MKKIIFFLSFLFFASFLSVPVFGETFDEIIEKQKQEFGLEDLEHSQPPETELFYEEPLALDGLSEILSPQKILFSVGNALVGAVTEIKVLFTAFFSFLPQKLFSVSYPIFIHRQRFLVPLKPC